MNCDAVYKAKEAQQRLNDAELDGIRQKRDAQKATPRGWKERDRLQAVIDTEHNARWANFEKLFLRQFGV